MAHLKDEIRAVLRYAPAPMSPWQITKAVEHRRPPKRFLWWTRRPVIGYGTMLNALEALERAGEVSSVWEPAEGNAPPRRVYWLTRTPPPACIRLDGSGFRGRA